MQGDILETGLLAGAGADRPTPNDSDADTQDLAALWVDLGGGD